MTDLFIKRSSKKDQLYNFIRDKKWVKTSEIILWGTKNYYNRADRTARDLAKENKIMRMSDDKKNFYFNHSKEDVWMIKEK